jgi:ABC-type Fe3+-hydroxamate transport system substrate-binding protein
MRIISLCPSLTELVFDLGKGDELVGRTKFCIHPADRVGAVEKVGGTKNPKLARIIELAPDIVLLNEEENRREDAAALEAAGIRCHVSFPHSALETAAMVRSIAAAIDAPREGDRIAQDIETRHDRVVRAAASRSPLRFAYLIWREPWMTANADTFVSALLTDAGGENVFAERADRYPTITPEELGAANPDVVLLSTEPFPFKPSHGDELAKRSGVPRERIQIVDGEMLSWHGSRTPAGIDYAERVVAGVPETNVIADTRGH